MSLSHIVRALGGDLHAGGRRANVPAPGHSAADRSVSLLLAGDRVVIHCFAGDDWRQVRADLEARGLVDRQGRLLKGRDAQDSPVETPGRAAREAIARDLWAQAGPIEGALSARYLRRRGVVGAAPSALRHHGQAPAAVYAGAGPRRPALLAAITDAEGALRGVELTYLSPAGDRARVALPRKIVGGCPAGSAVRLGTAGERLLVGEGVFTCLSAAAVFGLPAWALLSAGNLAVWRPPAGVKAVLIAADRGETGEAAAARLAAGLRARGVQVEVRWPPPPHADWNDAHRAGAAAR